MKIFINDQIIEIIIPENGLINLINNQLQKAIRLQSAIATEPHEQNFWTFIEEWINEKDYIIVQTSGSTGIPREIKLNKNAVIASAQRTIDFFRLKPGMNAWLCMDCKYIGAKMMVIRALIGNLNLFVTKPSKNPVEEYLNTFKEPIDFAAMVPMQLHSTAMKEIQELNLVKTLIIGGGNISEKLRNFINQSNLSTLIFETYGMTETISHIAIKELNDQDFTALPHVQISKNKEDCIIIEDKLLFNSDKIETNDLVEITETNKFKIIGRKDNIINSGGIKISPEKIENKIKNLISNDFIISHMPDDLLGCKIILIIDSIDNREDLLNRIQPVLEKYEMPKLIIELESLAYLDNQKIDRAKTRVLVIEKLLKVN